ncbi:MAG: hypothetical protein R2761_05960 [Acidimicrobiales bacterium]
MFTWGSKYLFGVAGVALLGAIVYGLVTGGGIVGVVSVGYKGGVGEHTGYGTLLGVAAAALGLGVLNFITRDATVPVAEAADDSGGGALAIRTPHRASFWGPLAAFGLACLAIGVAVSQVFFILGVAVLSIVLLEWVILAWSDSATGDPLVNSAIRERVIGPLEVPLLASLGIAVFILGVSRVLLAVSEAGSVVVASVVAAAIFASCIALAKTRVSRGVITGVVALGALAVLAGGIAGAVVGEREIGHHHETGETGTQVEGEGE